MPDMTGIELQQHLVRAGIDIPTIAITAHSELVQKSGVDPQAQRPI